MESILTSPCFGKLPHEPPVGVRWNGPQGDHPGQPLMHLSDAPKVETKSVEA